MAYKAEGNQRNPEGSIKDRFKSKQTDPSKDGFTGIGDSIADIMKQNAAMKKKAKKEEVDLEEAERTKASRLERKRKLYDKTAKKAMRDAMETGEASGHNRFRMSSINTEYEKLRDRKEEFEYDLTEEWIDGGAEVSGEYFFSEGLNEDGLEIVMEEVGLEDFIEFVTDPIEELNEERSARKAKSNAPSYEKVKAAVATIAEFFNYKLISTESNSNAVHHSPVHHALTKIEMPSILFFLGILMAVGALEALGIVFGVGQWMVSTFENVDWVIFGGLDIVVFVLGFLSAAIDNVPLVAASMGMFGEAIDDPLWHGIAYAAGTGGSMIIIGSAAGVVAMGMEKIDFLWYLKKIAFLAFIGYIAGFLTFILLRDFVLV